MTAFNAQQQESKQRSPSPPTSHTGNNSLVSAINNGYHTASREFEKFFTSWGFYKRSIDQEMESGSQKDKHTGKRKRQVDNNDNSTHLQHVSNDTCAIYGRIIPDEHRQHTLSSPPYNSHHPGTTLVPANNDTSPKKKRNNTDIYKYVFQRQASTRTEPNETTPLDTEKDNHRPQQGITPPSMSSLSTRSRSYLSFTNCKDFDQLEQERIERLKRSIETLESKSSFLQSPKSTRTVRFSPVVEHASIITPPPSSTPSSLSAYKHARQSLSLEPTSPRRMPTTTTTTVSSSSRVHDNPFLLTKDTPNENDHHQEDTSYQTDALPPTSSTQPTTITTEHISSSFDQNTSLSTSTSVDSSDMRNHQVKRGLSFEPSSPLKKKPKTQGIGKEHKKSMALIIDQIPTVKLRRTDTIRGPDGQTIPNRFWNEIYNNGKNKSRPL
ncbi:hypothetical protein BC941DRAFT_423248 [Chlamydoabsidia padenii]|nr:hypothetical protein BC941DRAFT_423248 [Chlamydoabsidia padenii]